MLYKVLCRCGATCWVPGSYDPETNATELSEKAAYEWDGGDGTCEEAEGSYHDVKEIVDQEDEDTSEFDWYEPTNYR